MAYSKDKSLEKMSALLLYDTAKGIGDAPASTWVMLSLQGPQVFSLHRLYYRFTTSKAFQNYN